MATYPVPYNGTGTNGGDSLTEDLNIYYSVSFFCSGISGLDHSNNLTSLAISHGLLPQPPLFFS